MSEPGVAIRAERLFKSYGATSAVDGVDLAIPRSQFFGLLGPNGAGKTSIVHMLSTLIRPTSGEAWVAGYSTSAQKLAVRRSIGVVFQEQALDRTLTVAENLRFAGLLNGAEYDLMPFLVTRLFPLATYGELFGRLMLFSILSGGVGLVGFGVLHDWTGSYATALGIGAVAMLLATFLLYCVPPYDPRVRDAAEPVPAQ